ncbi:MAG TPA: hypothetical protein PK812_08250 [Beijerinckiaceae bacterium]|nr:hypothetical protein [Beijerinckiaceae bacterium]
MLRAATLLFLLSPALAGQPGVAGDCAGMPSVQRPCASSEIDRLTREVETAYSVALNGIGSAGRSALKRDQESFRRILDQSLSLGDQDAETLLTLRRDLLDSIRPSRGEWTGSWANAFGTIEILATSGGNYHVRLHAADPGAGGWVCEFEDSAILAPRGIAMIVGAESAADDHGGPNEGWTLAFRLAGDILMVEPLRPKGFPGAMPFCGKGGNVAGNFFAQDHGLALRRTSERK